MSDEYELRVTGVTPEQHKAVYNALGGQAIHHIKSYDEGLLVIGSRHLSTLARFMMYLRDTHDWQRIDMELVRSG